MLAFFDGLPDGAITQHKDLIRQCIAASKKALETYRPNTPDALAKNRRILGEALRITVGYDDSTVTYQHNTKENGTLIGNRRNVRVPIRTFTPESPSDTSTLLIHPQGMDALYSPVIHTLLDKGHTVYAIDPFGTGQNIGEENPEEPRGGGNFFNTFKPHRRRRSAYTTSHSHCITSPMARQTSSALAMPDSGPLSQVQSQNAPTCKSHPTSAHSTPKPRTTTSSACPSPAYSKREACPMPPPSSPQITCSYTTQADYLRHILG